MPTTPSLRASIVITSYNQRSYLTEAVESALAQTLRPWEVIVADDGSTDGSPEVIRAYAERYPGWVKGVFQRENMGIPRNRNAGLRLATGDAVAILDGDDRLLPNCLAAHQAALDAGPGAGCSYSNVWLIGPDGARARRRDEAPRPAGDVFAYVAAARLGLMRSMLMRLDLVQRAGYMDESHPKYDGYLLSLSLARLTRFVYTFEPLAEYRVHAQGDSRSFSSREGLRHLMGAHEAARRQTADLPAESQRQIEAAWRRKLLRQQVRAELDEGRRFRAMLHIVRALAANPAIVRDAGQLFAARVR
jgi:glycosyltransferase involved in cell wall biosynthesis